MTIICIDPDYVVEICSVCGLELDWVECCECGGNGGFDNDELMALARPPRAMEEDPLWYDGIEWETCQACHGEGGWTECPALPHEPGN